MGLVTVPVFTLASAVANSGTVVIDYPQGYTQDNFTGSRASARGVAVINSNDIHEEVREKISLNYGASEITLTNFSGVTWEKRARLLVQLAFAEVSGGSGGDPVPLLPSALTELFEDAAETPSLGARIAAAFTDALSAINDAGGPPAEALGAELATSADSGGTAILPATAAQLWAETDGFLIVTPQGLKEAEAVQTITPVAGEIAVDGAAGWNFEGTITAATAFIAPVGLTRHTRKVRLLADGGAFAVTNAVAGFDRTANFDAGVEIPDGKWGTFLCDVDGADDTVLTFAGYSD